MDKKDKIKKNVPSYFKPTINVHWKALLESHGIEDQTIVEQANEAKNQIFVEKAEKNYLDALGDNVAVFRPLELNLSDKKFSKLIEFLSFYPKQIKTLILDVLDVFYDETFSRYDIQTQNSANYNLFGGECLVVKTEVSETIPTTKLFTANGETDGPGTVRVASTSGMYVGQQVQISDNNSDIITAQITGLTQTVITTNKTTINFTTSQQAIIFFDTYDHVIFSPDDFEVLGSATAEEVAIAINNALNDATAQVLSSGTKISLRTNTPGIKGFINVLGGTANDILLFPTTLQSQSLRVLISEINPNEIVIKIPSTIPALRRVLKGSAHLHPDSTLVSNWEGSFLYDNSVNYTVKQNKTVLNQTILKGHVYTQLSVVDSSGIPNEFGKLIFNFGLNGIELDVPYIGRPNNSTLLLDPSYVFTEDHVTGDVINTMILEQTVPRSGGGDYPVYMVGVEEAREQVQEIVRSIVATGVVIRWEITTPICGKF